MDASAYFRDKKITVMGLGLLGGVGDIQYVAESGADIIATDLKSEAELKPSLDILSRYPNITFRLGTHDLADFRDRDLVIKAPGCPADSPYIAEARKNGIEVTMWAALFSRFAREAGATIVGVTGTRGKTTVTVMIAAILREAGTSMVEGGNVQGTSVLPQLSRVDGDTIAVLELDSWKLQGFGEAHMSPDVAVFTTFYDDHLNYYGGDRDAYLADKANIFLYQSEADVLVIGKQCAPTLIEKYGQDIHAKTLVVDETKLPDTWPLKIPGIHNRYNAALALGAARELGVSDEAARRALTEFAGVPGRLEFLREVKGVKMYNDTTSTTPEATIAALEALGPAHTVVIVGGTDKDLGLRALLRTLPAAKGIVLLEGSGTDRLAEQLKEAAGEKVSGPFSKLSRAVMKAIELAEAGDNVLFSPAFTSFGMFKNEYDRGEQFNALVEQL